MYTYKPPLNLYVVWHPKTSLRCRELARDMYVHFSGDPEDPSARRIGIPVYFRSAPADGGNALPRPIDLSSAERCVVVLLVEHSMVADTEFNSSLVELRDRVRQDGPNHKILPIAVTDTAFNLRNFGDLNFIRLFHEEESNRTAALLRDVTHFLCRLMLADTDIDETNPAAPAPVKFFISHTKRDSCGLTVAEAIREAIDGTQVQTWFDSGNITHGYDFKSQIEDALQDCAFIAVRTNGYSESPWCRMEAQLAKARKLPMVVADQLMNKEERGLPLFGNIPHVRFFPFTCDLCELTPDRPELKAAVDRLLQTALTEVLRIAHAGIGFANLRSYNKVDDDTVFMPRPPDTIDLWHTATERGGEPFTVLYPDPPVGEEVLGEIGSELLRRHAMTLTTPATIRSGSLTGRIIGISISDVGEGPASRGKSELHLNTAMNDFARYLLQAGAVVAYGGDLRPGGFTEMLFEYVKRMGAARRETFQPLVNYFAWPIYLKADDEWIAKNTDVADFKRIPPPEDLVDKGMVDADTFIPPDSPEHLYIRARCLTLMRERMTDDINARIIVGGRLYGYKGKYPGIVEEALLAVRKGIPLYILGGLDGAAEAVAKAIVGEHPVELTMDYQAKADPNYAETARYYNERAEKCSEMEPIDYDALVAEFRSAGIAGLNNGLTEEENLRLFELDGRETDLEEAIRLVLDGLTRTLKSS